MAGALKEKEFATLACRADVLQSTDRPSDPRHVFCCTCGMNDAFLHARMLLTVQPLTQQAFAPYGTVLAAPANAGRSINGGNAERFDLVGDLQLGSAGGRAMLALFRAQARRFPHEVTEMERHALGSQTFVPLGKRRFVIVVAQAGDAPSADTLAAFITDGLQGITLAPGTWHHALLAVDAGDFVVIERAAGAVDCELCALSASAVVDWKG
jgi:ureidoglycolate lyase